MAKSYLTQLKEDAKLVVQDMLNDFKHSKASQVYSENIVGKPLLTEIKKILEETPFVAFDVQPLDGDTTLLVYWVGDKSGVAPKPYKKPENVIFVDFVNRKVLSA